MLEATFNDVVDCCNYLHTVDTRMHVHGTSVELYWQWRREVIGENPVSATLSTKKIPYEWSYTEHGPLNRRKDPYNVKEMNTCRL